MGQVNGFRIDDLLIITIIQWLIIDIPLLSLVLCFYRPSSWQICSFSALIHVILLPYPGQYFLSNNCTLHSACTLTPDPYARFQYDTWLVPALSIGNDEPVSARQFGSSCSQPGMLSSPLTVEYSVHMSQEWWGSSRAQYHPLLRVWPSVFQGLISTFKPANLNIKPSYHRGLATCC